MAFFIHSSTRAKVSFRLKNSITEIYIGLSSRLDRQIFYLISGFYQGL